MEAHRLILLGLFLFVGSFTKSMAKGKFGKLPNDQSIIPKSPIRRPPGFGPVVLLRPFSVEIHNDLRMFLLDVHCFSKEDDLGLHTLFPDEQQNWQFRENLFATTKFTCKLEWEHGLLEFASFEEDSDFLISFCLDNAKCVWSARQDGVYLADNNGNFVFRDYWDMLRK